MWESMNLSEVIMNVTSIKRNEVSFEERITLLRVLIGLVIKGIHNTAFLFKINFFISYRSIINGCTFVTTLLMEFIPCKWSLNDLSLFNELFLKWALTKPILISILISIKIFYLHVCRNINSSILYGHWIARSLNLLMKSCMDSHLSMSLTSKLWIITSVSSS